MGDAIRDDIERGDLSNGPAADLDETLRARVAASLAPAVPPPRLEPTELWQLASINCWTNGPAEYFAQRLRALIPDVPVRELGVTASEGTFAFPLGMIGQGPSCGREAP